MRAAAAAVIGALLDGGKEKARDEEDNDDDDSDVRNIDVVVEAGEVGCVYTLVRFCLRCLISDVCSLRILSSCSCILDLEYE